MKRSVLPTGERRRGGCARVVIEGIHGTGYSTTKGTQVGSCPYTGKTRSGLSRLVCGANGR